MLIFRFIIRSALHVPNIIDEEKKVISTIRNSRLVFPGVQNERNIVCRMPCDFERVKLFFILSNWAIAIAYTYIQNTILVNFGIYKLN